MAKSKRHSASAARSSSSKGGRGSAHFSTYWERTHWPLQSLYFLLPLVVLYEVGVVLWAGPNDILARGLLRMFFEQLGVTGYYNYLPGLVVVAVLISWHAFRQDPWKPEPKLYGLMWLESLALALVLFVGLMALLRGPAHPPASGEMAALTALQSATEPVGDWKAQLILPIGAGIYEELLFRLIAIALLHMLLVDVLALPEQYGTVGAVSLSAVAFALYHFNEDNPFTWGMFSLYTVAGLYFATIYMLRGFGIVAAVHALYDVMVALAKMAQGE